MTHLLTLVKKNKKIVLLLLVILVVSLMTMKKSEKFFNASSHQGYLNSVKKAVDDETTYLASVGKKIRDFSNKYTYESFSSTELPPTENIGKYVISEYPANKELVDWTNSVQPVFLQPELSHLPEELNVSDAKHESVRANMEQMKTYTKQFETNSVKKSCDEYELINSHEKCLL